MPTTNDDIVVTNGQCVLLPEDGTCNSFVVTNEGFLIVNHAGRTLDVIGNGIADGSETELRVNSGHLNVGGNITLLNDARMILDASSSTATFQSLDFRDGHLDWNAGILRFTDDLYMWGGNPVSNLIVETGRTLEVKSSDMFGKELSVGTGGTLTLAGGTVNCDAFAKTAAGTLDHQAGTLRVNGDGFDWDGSPFVVEGSASTNQAALVIYDYVLPQWVTLTNGIDIAPTAGRQGHLQVEAYSNLDAPGTLGEGVGSLGSAVVTNASVWKAGTLTVGGAGTGTLTIEDYSIVQDCSKLEVGRDSTATGIVTVAGAGSHLSSYWQAQIGGHGSAQVRISNGATMNFGAQVADTEFARYSGSVADLTVTGPGSQLGIQSDAYSHTIYFGLHGQASLLVSNGASVTWDEFTTVGESSSGRGDIVVTGSNSAWTVDNDLWLGYEGTGTVRVLDGGTFHTDQAKLGEYPGGVGQVTISGPGSTWHGGGYESTGGEFLIGRYGTGEITVEDGGLLTSSGFSELGQYSGSRGTVTVTDPGSLWSVSDVLYIGFYGSGITGEVTVANSGLVTVAKTASLFADGTLTLNDGGTLDAKTLDLTHGDDITGDTHGILRVHSVSARPTDWTLPATLQIGSTSHQASTSWTIGSGESLTVENTFCVGFDDAAALLVTNTGQIISDSGIIGQLAGATGQVTVTGSSASWTVSNHLTIGDAGTGRLSLTDAGSVTADTITVGTQGTVSLDHGTVLDVRELSLIENASLIGDGAINGNVTSAGILSPGFSPGILRVAGNVELLSTSQVEIELAGTHRGTEFDGLDVIGAMTLGGTLAVSLDGFTPALGDRFDLLQWVTLQAGSTFDAYDLPSLPAGQEWYTDNLTVDGSIRVSLPAAWLAKYGLSPTNDPFGDPDEDEFSTAEEYTTDTNPTNGASYFQIDDVDGYPDPTIHFNSSTGRMYTLAICSNMLVESWADVPGAGPRAGVGGSDTFGDTNEPVQGFFYYRLGVELP